MSTEDKILYVGLAALAVGVLFLYKKKPDGKADEDLNVIRQSCVNAGLEKKVPAENMDKFVEDCTKSLMAQEEAEVSE